MKNENFGMLIMYSYDDVTVWGVVCGVWCLAWSITLWYLCYQLSEIMSSYSSSYFLLFLSFTSFLVHVNKNNNVVTYRWIWCSFSQKERWEANTIYGAFFFFHHWNEKWVLMMTVITLYVWALQLLHLLKSQN